MMSSGNELEQFFFWVPIFPSPLSAWTTRKRRFFWGVRSSELLGMTHSTVKLSEFVEPVESLRLLGAKHGNPSTKRCRLLDRIWNEICRILRGKNMGMRQTQPNLVECVCGNFCSSITILRSVEGLQEKGRCSLDIPFYQHSWLCDYHPRGFLCKSTLEKGPIKCRPTVWFLADGHYGLHRWRARRHFLHSERCTPRRWTEQTRGSWKRATWHWPFSHNSPFRYHLLRYVGCQKSETVPID